MVSKVSLQRNTSCCVSQTPSNTIRELRSKSKFTSIERTMRKASFDDAGRSSDMCECIAVMLRQEETTYQCPDYLSPDWLAQHFSTASTIEVHNMVGECANLVTDLRLAADQPNKKVTAEVPSSPSCQSKIKKSPSSTAVAANFNGSRPVTPNLFDHNSHLGPWREQMCAWAYSVVDKFDLDREIVAVTFHLLDRYLAKETLTFETITREDFQLFVMTALYIAVKMLEPVRKLSIEALVDMSRGFYSDVDILATELHILQTLKWHVNPPTALAFTRKLLDATSCLKESCTFVARCRHMTELAVKDPSLLSTKASSVAVAAILLCAEQDPRHSASSIDQFLADTAQLGVDVATVAAVYRRLEALSCH